MYWRPSVCAANDKVFDRDFSPIIVRYLLPQFNIAQKFQREDLSRNTAVGLSWLNHLIKLGTREFRYELPSFPIVTTGHNVKPCVSEGWQHIGKPIDAESTRIRRLCSVMNVEFKLDRYNCFCMAWLLDAWCDLSYPESCARAVLCGLACCSVAPLSNCAWFSSALAVCLCGAFVRFCLQLLILLPGRPAGCSARDEITLRIRPAILRTTAQAVAHQTLSFVRAHACFCWGLISIKEIQVTWKL